MSLFGTILESVIAEIGAEDAYNRFYSSIPREDYNKIVGGNGNVDKVVQFALNCVRDGKSNTDSAANMVQSLRAADNNTRNMIMTKFKTGEYEDVDDVLDDIEMYTKMGGMSKKKFAKDGLIKLSTSPDGKWNAYCTTTYAANNHTFGTRAHWCTSSDRNGDYDGWRMFNRYTVESDGCLIQFESVENPNILYQLQVFDNGDTGEVQSMKNNSEVDAYTVRNIVGDDFFESIMDMAPKLIELTREANKGGNHIQQYRRQLKEEEIP